MAMMENHADNERIITQYAETRDPQLREKAIICFLPIVHFVLGRLGYKAYNRMDYEDLVSQGVLGLIEAVDHFDISYGTKFSTYAVPRVRGKILDFLRMRDWLPRSARERVKSVQLAMKELRGKRGRMPTDEEIAQHLDMQVKHVQQSLIYANQVFVSLDSYLPWLQDESDTFDEYLQDENQSDPSQIYFEKSLKEQLVHAMKQMEERDQIILSLYYYEELTMREIGEVIGVSESRVCQLHARAVMDLKNILSQGDGSNRMAEEGIPLKESEVLRHV